MTLFRHQLPAHSPLTLGGVLAALLEADARSCALLEDRLRERFGARRVVLCGSGTQALTLALRSAAPAGRRPLVALPAYACYDLVSAAVGADAGIVFYDLEPDTLSPLLPSLEQACSTQPDAVVVAPLFGLPVDWDRVEGVVRASGALLVEDAAQGLGASWGGRPLGSLGDVSILSFGRGKGWTGGVGGALLERSPRTGAPATTASVRRTAGLAARVLAQWALGRPALYGIPAGIPGLGLGETLYHPPAEPTGIPAFAAALALRNEGASLDACGGRRAAAEALYRLLQTGTHPAGVEIIRPSVGGEPGFLRLPLLGSRGMAGFADRRRAASLGIMPGYPRPLPELPEATRRIQAAHGGSSHADALPGATRLAAELVTLPTHALTTSADRERIAEVVARYEP